MKRMVLALVAVLLMASASQAARWHTTYFTNQTGGVADSMAAAADTSEAFAVPVDADNLFITSVADSNALRYIQVKTSNARWASVVFDSVNSVSGAFAKGRVSNDLAAYLRGKTCRVILDRAKAAAGWAQSWISWYY